MRKDLYESYSAKSCDDAQWRTTLDDIRRMVRWNVTRFQASAATHLRPAEIKILLREEAHVRAAIDEFFDETADREGIAIQALIEASYVDDPWGSPVRSVGDAVGLLPGDEELAFVRELEKKGVVRRERLPVRGSIMPPWRWVRA